MSTLEMSSTMPTQDGVTITSSSTVLAITVQTHVIAAQPIIISPAQHSHVELLLEDNAAATVIILFPTTTIPPESDTPQGITVRIHQQAHSQLTITTIALNSGNTQVDLTIDLDGVGAECQCKGAILTHHNAMTNLVVTHHTEHTTANILYKHLLDAAATGSFNGRIIVEPNAQHTTATMTSNNLLVTADARMTTKPELEIHADDVQCSHGATIGHLDDNALFYLCQRAIPRPIAQQLLYHAFLNDILAPLPQDIAISYV